MSDAALSKVAKFILVVLCSVTIVSSRTFKRFRIVLRTLANILKDKCWRQRSLTSKAVILSLAIYFWS